MAPGGLAQKHVARKSRQQIARQVGVGVARFGVYITAQHAPAWSEQAVDGYAGLHQPALAEDRCFLISIECGFNTLKMKKIINISNGIFPGIIHSC